MRALNHLTNFMLYKFASNNFLRKTYNEVLFDSYILPWNCHDLAAKKQNYFYTHRYKAVLGFDFSYVMVGAQFPEFENTGFAGIGFFNSFGETSWIVLESTDGRVDIRGGAKNCLPKSVTDNGLHYYYYNGIYYNIHNAIGDQVNNLAPHYIHNVFSSIVNFDRGVQSYFEQTYWQHMAPGHWRNVAAGPLIPGILSVKPCARSDSFFEFFNKPRHWINKLNYLSLADSDLSKSFSNVYNMARFSRSRRILFANYFNNLVIRKSAWRARARQRRKIDTGFAKLRLRTITNSFYSIQTPKIRNRSLVKRRLRSYLPNSLRLYRSYTALRSIRTFFKKWKLRPKKKRWKGWRKRKLNKKLRSNALIRSKFSHMKKYSFTSKSSAESRRLFCFKKGLLFLSGRYNKKRRRNRRLWYLVRSQPYRNPLAAKKAIRYKKSYKGRKYIFVF